MAKKKKKRSKRCVGIDPSLTGLAGFRSDGASYEAGLDKIGDGVHARRQRVDGLVQPFMEWLEPYDPEVIVLEGYFGQMRATTLRLIELGWTLRQELSWVFPTAKIYEAAPTSMKKVITGNGNATKTQVAMALASELKIVLSSDNLADALGFHQIALMLIGDVPVPAAERESFDKIAGQQ